jgi:hypothetical protein
VVPALDPVRMIEPPCPISGSAFWTVKIEPFTLLHASVGRHAAIDPVIHARQEGPAT